jgi:hypothetical protein
MKTPVQILLDEQRRTKEQLRKERIQLLMDSLPFFEDVNYLTDGGSIRFKDYAEEENIYGVYVGYFDTLNEGISQKLIKASIARLLLKIKKLKTNLDNEKDSNKRLEILASMAEVNAALSALDPNQSNGVLNIINQIIASAS